jgi:hypothetical protein
MTDADDVWAEYPSEIVTQAQQSVVLAEQQLNSIQPCDHDPYNVSLVTLMRRWLKRRGPASGN